jgi:hypothetical protein
MRKFTSIEDMLNGMREDYSTWDKFITHPSMNWLRWLIYNAKEVPHNFYRKCTRGWQRAYRGWADEDTWNLDRYLAVIIKESVSYLKLHNYGCPDGLTEKEWDEILSDIIYTFDRMDAEKRLDTVFIDYVRFERGFTYFKKYFRNLWS